MRYLLFVFVLAACHDAVSPTTDAGADRNDAVTSRPDTSDNEDSSVTSADGAAIPTDSGEADIVADSSVPTDTSPADTILPTDTGRQCDGGTAIDCGPSTRCGVCLGYWWENRQGPDYCATEAAWQYILHCVMGY